MHRPRTFRNIKGYIKAGAIPKRRLAFFPKRAYSKRVSNLGSGPLSGEFFFRQRAQVGKAPWGFI
jgi:hypothetical protein